MEKKIFLVFVVFITILGCTAVKTDKAKIFTMENRYITQNGMNIPILTNQQDKAPPLGVIRHKIANEEFQPRNGKQPELKDGEYGTFYEKINDTIGRYFTVRGNRVIEILESLSETEAYDFSYNTDIYPKYRTIRKYYPNGQLKSFEVYSESIPYLLAVGTWYRFDQDGNLVLTIDHEKHFKSSYTNILKIAVSYARNLKRPIGEIYRSFDEKISYWKITLHRHANVGRPLYYIIVDDETGEVLYDYSGDDPGKGWQRPPTKVDDYNGEYLTELYRKFRE